MGVGVRERTASLIIDAQHCSAAASADKAHAGFGTFRLLAALDAQTVKGIENHKDLVKRQPDTWKRRGGQIFPSPCSHI